VRCSIIWSAHIIQGEHKRSLHFQNDTENKCGVLRTSHPHQSIEKLSQFCFKWPGDCCCCAPLLDATSFENGYPTCVLQLGKIERVTAVQRTTRTQYHTEPPSRVSI